MAGSCLHSGLTIARTVVVTTDPINPKAPDPQHNAPVVKAAQQRVNKASISRIKPFEGGQRTLEFSLDAAQSIGAVIPSWLRHSSSRSKDDVVTQLIARGTGLVSGNRRRDQPMQRAHRS